MLTLAKNESAEWAELVNIDGSEVLGGNNLALADEGIGLGVDIDEVFDSGVAGLCQSLVRCSGKARHTLRSRRECGPQDWCLCKSSSSVSRARCRGSS